MVRYPVLGRAEQNRPPGFQRRAIMKNVVVTANFDHDTWVEVQFGFVALAEGEQLPPLTELVGVDR